MSQKHSRVITDSWCVPDTTFDCKFVCNSAQMAALSEWAAVIFSPHFTSYYSPVTVETDPYSQPTEETTSAVKINELWPTVWQERETGDARERIDEVRQREGGGGEWGINREEFSWMKREKDYFQNFLQDLFILKVSNAVCYSPPSLWFHILPPSLLPTLRPQPIPI